MCGRLHFLPMRLLVVLSSGQRTRSLGSKKGFDSPTYLTLTPKADNELRRRWMNGWMNR